MNDQTSRRNSCLQGIMLASTSSPQQRPRLRSPERFSSLYLSLGVSPIARVPRAIRPQEAVRDSAELSPMSSIPGSVCSSASGLGRRYTVPKHECRLEQHTGSPRSWWHNRGIRRAPRLKERSFNQPSGLRGDGNFFSCWGFFGMKSGVSSEDA